MKIKHGQLPNIRKPSTNINKQTNIYRNSEIMPHHSDKFKCKKKKKNSTLTALKRESLEIHQPLIQKMREQILAAKLYSL